MSCPKNSKRHKTQKVCHTFGDYSGLAFHPTSFSPSSPAVQNLHERSHAQLFKAQAGHQRFGFGNRSAVESAEEEVEQSLPGSGIVKDIADERGLSCLFHERFEPD